MPYDTKLLNGRALPHSGPSAPNQASCSGSSLSNLAVTLHP